ncbi:hypothetical protein THC_1462 [Caldimicrobium thiodismutans]|jgi:hypothetical protein|uniref:Uncharacterized protein n=1 Tax=Caldimicrobium thiodismutans TaxID=1653476 RepID=A0A0U5AIU3_9BACT|nr:hypothetical protein [Caldimicrobium thiodismutans]BAU23827.1 hypothetical protein THC_1462 [Caldimicrobium thiodismutans]
MVKKLLGLMVALGLAVSPVIAAEQAGAPADQGQDAKKAEKKPAKKATKKAKKAKKAENATQEAPKQ